MEPLLKVENLHLSLLGSSAPREILNGISFDLYPGEIVGLVGASGCGKSMTASSLLGLLPPGHRLTGKILFEGNDLVNQSEKEMGKFRGSRLGLILQDPSLALNPLIPIGTQLIEGLCYHQKLSWKAALQIGLRWLSRVGISDPEVRMRQYPHELSGGMKQRILIAMALILNPALVIADEPTTALDLTIQAQILDLIEHLHKEEKMSLLLITHDLGVVGRLCNRVIVMHEGAIVESGATELIFSSPSHPCTQALFQARYNLEKMRDHASSFA